MEGPIYKFFRLHGTEEWYRLTPAERNELLAKEAEIRNQLGVKNLVTCASSWSNERWDAYGVHEYADMDMVLKHAAGLQSIELSRYLETETMLGTIWQGLRVTG
jgi:hypothetical protein